MTFSIRTFLVVIAILSVWLGALVSKSPLLVELAAAGTVLLILLSLALAIWDPRPLQRAFWTGFFALAFGNLLYNGLFSSYQKISNQVAQVIMGDYQPPSYGPVPYYPAPARGGVISFPTRTALYAAEEEYYTPSQEPVSPVPNMVNSVGEKTQSFPSNPLSGSTPEPATDWAPASYPSTPAPAGGSYSAPMPTTPAQFVWQPATANYHEQHEAIRASIPSLLSLLMGVIGGCVTMWIASRPKPTAA